MARVAFELISPPPKTSCTSTIERDRTADAALGVEGAGMSDITKERAAMVARIVRGDGQATREQRRAAFRNEGVEASLRVFTAFQSPFSTARLSRCTCRNDSYPPE